ANGDPVDPLERISPLAGGRRASNTDHNRRTIMAIAGRKNRNNAVLDMPARAGPLSHTHKLAVRERSREPNPPLPPSPQSARPRTRLNQSTINIGQVQTRLPRNRIPSTIQLDALRRFERLPDRRPRSIARTNPSPITNSQMRTAAVIELTNLWRRRNNATAVTNPSPQINNRGNNSRARIEPDKRDWLVSDRRARIALTLSRNRPARTA